MPSPNFGSYRELNPSILRNPLSHNCFCIKEALEEHLADAPRYNVSTRARARELARCTNGTPTHPLSPLGNPTGDQSEGQAAYGYAGFNGCAQGASTLAANSSISLSHSF